MTDQKKMHPEAEPSRPGTKRPSGPTIWVCIAVFNRMAYTRRCLVLLRSQTYRHIVSVVVDDGSTDSTAAMIRQEFPEVQLIEAAGLFWTAAMHKGLAHIFQQADQSDYTLLLNNDLVFGVEFVERLLAISSSHPNSLIQAVESCVRDPDVIWQGGVHMNWWTAKHTRLNHNRRLSEFPPGHCERSDYLTGRGVLASVEVLRSVGNYDVRHVQYGDGEFTRRAAKKGYSLLVAYDLPVYSYEKGNNLNEAESYRFLDLAKYYFGRLSSANLAIRWRQATSMTNHGIQALVFFACDFIRITVHFLKRLKIPHLQASSS